MEEVGIFAEPANCIGCGKLSAGIPPLAWRTVDGFEIEWPCCGHGKYVICPDCSATVEGKCPVCGCNVIYT